MGTGMSDTMQHDKSQDLYYERLKLFFLTAAFFCVIGAYTVAKELKNSVIAHTVGVDYIPLVRTGVMFALIPVLFLYSNLIDRLRRYQILCVCSGAFAVLGLVFAYLLGQPGIGILNTDESPYRLFGWFFYFFVEGYSPFVVSVFWAFANSINSPEEARNNYGLMVSGSKLGGMLTAGLAMILLTLRTADGNQLYTDVTNHQILLIGTSVMLLMVPIIITIMMKKIPGRYLHGYEAVYQVEKERKHGEGAGVLAGLVMLIKYPYVLGIFGMTFFYEVVSTVLSYLSVKMARDIGSTASESLWYLLKIILFTHLVGFFISLFGTSVLFRALGVKRCLFLIPVSTGAILLYYMLNVTSAGALLIALVALRSINYAFSYPLRESLYIPTIKEIKFKSKSWIDAFGSKFAKTSGSSFNIFAQWIGKSSASYMTTYSFFFAGVVGLWGLTAWLLGVRFDRAVAKDEVIGIENES